MTATLDTRSSRPETRAGGSNFTRAWNIAASFGMVLVLWWIASMFLDAQILPSPWEVLLRGRDLIAGNSELSLGRNVPVSVLRVLVGWASAVVIGVLIGGLMVMSTTVRNLLDPLVEFTRPLPPLAFAPLFVVWFGFGELPKALLIFLSAMPIMVIATISGASAADQTRIHCAQMLGARPHQVFTAVVLPGALPEVLTGARLAAGAAWGTLVAAELIASDRGIGYMILRAGSFLDTRAVFVGIVVIGVLAFGMDSIIRLVQRRLVPWKGKTSN